MKQLKVSAVVALAVTLLAVVIAVSFSAASFYYQGEVKELRQINREYKQTLDEYQKALEGIRHNLAAIEVSR